MTGDDPKGVVVVLNVISVQPNHNVLTLRECIYPSDQNEETTLPALHILFVQTVETIIQQ